MNAAEHLLSQFQASHYVLHKNLEGISQEESLKPLVGGGNSMNWVLGHIVATRQLVLEILEQTPVWDADLRAAYSGTPLETSRMVPFKELVGALDRSQELVQAGFQKLSEEKLAASAFGSTVGGWLATLAFHEAYHGGQIGLLRRPLGHPGVIKPPKLPPR